MSRYALEGLGERFSYDLRTCLPRSSIDNFETQMVPICHICNRMTLRPARMSSRSPFPTVQIVVVQFISIKMTPPTNPRISADSMPLSAPVQTTMPHLRCPHYLALHAAAPRPTCRLPSQPAAATASCHGPMRKLSSLHARCRRHCVSCPCLYRC